MKRFAIMSILAIGLPFCSVAYSADFDNAHKKEIVTDSNDYLDINASVTKVTPLSALLPTEIIISGDSYVTVVLSEAQTKATKLRYRCRLIRPPDYELKAE